VGVGGPPGTQNPPPLLPSGRRTTKAMILVLIFT
jgi:hypothetical protein